MMHVDALGIVKDQHDMVGRC